MTTAKTKETARIENWLKTVGIDASKSQDLIEKYGVSNTYKLVQESLMRPHDMAKHLDGTRRSSRNTINYLLDNTLSPEEISAVTKTDLDQVKSDMPQKPKIEVVERPEAPEVTIGNTEIVTSQPVVQEQTQTKEDERAQTKASLIDQAQASVSPDEEKRNPMATSQNIRFGKRMEQKAITSENLAKAKEQLLETVTRSSSRYGWQEAMTDSLTLKSIAPEDFLAEAKNKFSKNEGNYPEPYFDCEGHPTIGIGMLITRRDSLQTNTILQNTSLASQEGNIISAANIINDKNAYYIHNGKKVNLYSSERDNTPNITSIPEGSNINIIDTNGNTVTVNRIHGAGAKIIAVNGQNIGKLSNEEVNELYKARVKQDYKRVCKAVPNFEKMPEHVQYVAVHMCFYSPATFTKDYEEIFGKPLGSEISPSELVAGMEKYYEGRKVSTGVKDNLKLARTEVDNLTEFTLSQRKVVSHLPEIVLNDKIQTKATTGIINNKLAGFEMG